MNVEVSNHMQALEDDQIKTLDKSLDSKKVTIIQNKTLKIITKKQQNNNNNKNNNKQSNKGNANQKGNNNNKIMPK